MQQVCLNGSLSDVDNFLSKQGTSDPSASQEKLSDVGVSEELCTSTCEAEPMPEYLPSDEDGQDGELSEAVNQLNIDGPRQDLNKEERDTSSAREEDDGWTVVGKKKQR